MIEDLKSAIYCASVGMFFFVGCIIGNEFGLILIIQSVLSGIMMVNYEDERDRRIKLRQKQSKAMHEYEKRIKELEKEKYELKAKCILAEVRRRTDKTA